MLERAMGGQPPEGEQLSGAAEAAATPRQAAAGVWGGSTAGAAADGLLLSPTVCTDPLPPDHLCCRCSQGAHRAGAAMHHQGAYQRPHQAADLTRGTPGAEPTLDPPTPPEASPGAYQAGLAIDVLDVPQSQRAARVEADAVDAVHGAMVLDDTDVAALGQQGQAEEGRRKCCFSQADGR